MIAIQTGTRVRAVEAAFNHIYTTYRPDAVITAGFAGALHCRGNIGQVILASRYLFYTPEGVVELPQLSRRNPRINPPLANEMILKRLQCRVPVREGSVVTVQRWMAKSKLRGMLPDDLPFPVCDGATINVAKMCYANNIPFFSVRSITHTLERDIPEELFGVIDPDGDYGLPRIGSLLLAKPSLIPHWLNLVRSTTLAAKNLWEAINALIGILPSPAANQYRDPIGILFRRRTDRIKNLP